MAPNDYPKQLQTGFQCKCATGKARGAVVIGEAMRHLVSVEGLCSPALIGATVWSLMALVHETGTYAELEAALAQYKDPEAARLDPRSLIAAEDHTLTGGLLN